MKIIYCEICKTKVAEIESGSKIKKNSVMVCEFCKYKLNREQTSNIENIFKTMGIFK